MNKSLYSLIKDVTNTVPAHKIPRGDGSYMYAWSTTQMLRLMRHELDNNKTLEPAIYDQLLDQYNELHKKVQDRLLELTNKKRGTNE